MKMGCYHCLEIFELSNVAEFTEDLRPICPHCDMDTVAEAVYATDDDRERERLLRIHNKKF